MVRYAIPARRFVSHRKTDGPTVLGIMESHSSARRHGFASGREREEMHVKEFSKPIRTAAAALLLLIAITAVARAARTQDQEDQAAAGAFQRVCSSCHDAQRILATRRTRTQWEEVIGKMIDRGATGTDEDFTAAE